MGWVFTHHCLTKGALVEYLQRPDRFGRNQLIDARVVGNHHWYLLSLPSGERIIGLDLMAAGTRGEPGWGYKDLDESVGPTAVDCPLSLLKRATPAMFETARLWRAQVVKHHADRARRARLANSLKAGVELTYGAHRFRLESKLGPRQGWLVKRVDDDQVYRMTAKQVSAAVCRS